MSKIWKESLPEEVKRFVNALILSISVFCGQRGGESASSFVLFMRFLADNSVDNFVDKNAENRLFFVKLRVSEEDMKRAAKP